MYPREAGVAVCKSGLLSSMKWSWKLFQVLSMAGSLFQKRKSSWKILASWRIVVAMLIRCSSDSCVPKAADMSLKVRKETNMWERGLDGS